MAAERDLCFTPAVELLKLYRSHRASPLEVMQTILARIDAYVEEHHGEHPAGRAWKAYRGRGKKETSQ